MVLLISVKLNETVTGAAKFTVIYERFDEFTVVTAKVDALYSRAEAKNVRVHSKNNYTLIHEFYFTDDLGDNEGTNYLL